MYETFIVLDSAQQVLAKMPAPPPTPLITGDAVSFGVLMGVLGLIFYNVSPPWGEGRGGICSHTSQAKRPPNTLPRSTTKSNEIRGRTPTHLQWMLKANRWGVIAAGSVA